MKNTCYVLILLLFSFGLSMTSHAQDTSSCNAQFTATVSFKGVQCVSPLTASRYQHFWNFGDDQYNLGWGWYWRPVWMYNNIGVYRITHMVRDSLTGCFDSTSQNITIGNPHCNVTINYLRDTTKLGNPYWLLSTSDFGGGTTGKVTWMVNDTVIGTGWSIYHILQPGPSVVCATLITDSGCQSRYCKTIVDTFPLASCGIKFAWYIDSSKPNQPYHFYSTSYAADGKVDSVIWTANGTVFDIGDSVTHPFPTGNYNICATLRTSTGCQSQACLPLTVTPRDSAGPAANGADLAIQSYPNPTSNATNLVIQLDKPEMIYIWVYNNMGTQMGMKMVSGLMGTNVVPLSMGALQTGIYYIKVQYGNETKRGQIQKL